MASPPSHSSPLIKIDLEGLTLLLKESRTHPVVSLDVLVDVGSKDEPADAHGAAHAIEHLLFRTHDGDRPTDPAARLQRVGGEMNGYTTHDCTSCNLTVASRYLDFGLELQAEIFTAPQFREEDIETERRIILEEIRLYEENPFTAVQEEGHRRIFGDHPYARQVHGGSRAVKRLRGDRIIDFFESNYCRERMTVVAVGDFDADRLAAQIESSMKDIRSLRPPTPSFDGTPPKPEPGALHIERALQVSHLDLVFPAVPMSHPDFPALIALSIVFGEGRISRVFRELLERRQLVYSIGAAIPPMKLAGLFGVSTTLEPGREDEVRTALKGQIEMLRNGPVSPEELSMVRTKVEASAIFKNENVSGQSFTLGLVACLANPDYEEQFLAAVRTLTPDDLLGAAHEYLSEDSMVELCCGPRGKPIEPRQEPEPEEPPPSATPGDLAVPESGEYELLEDGGVKKIRLPNEAVILIREEHDLPLINVNAFLKVGSRDDPSGKSGTASLAQDMLHRGTKWRSADQLAFAAESLGAEFGGACSLDTTRLEAYGLSSDFPDLVKLFAEVLLHPRFDPAELEKLRPQLVAEISAHEDDVDQLANQMVSEAVFGEHPYARCPLGTVETVSEITADDLSEFHASTYCGENLVVAVVGNVPWQDAASRLAGALRDLPARGKPLGCPADLPDPQGVINLSLKKPFAPSSISIGWRLPPTDHPDHPALLVLSVVLGGPFSSRLWRELREERGLAYACGAGIIRGLDAGLFMANAATGKRHLKEAGEILLRQIADLQADGCTEEELELARNYIIGSHELGHQGPSAWAEFLASFEVSGLGWAYDLRYPGIIEQVTPDDVRRVAQAYLPLDSYVRLTITPQGWLSTVATSLFHRLFGGGA